MQKIRAILVDDETKARRVLKNLLDECCTNVDVVAECASVTEAVEVIPKNEPDVVFLDIQMPKHYGFELFRFIKDVNFEVVFVTAFDEYAIKAFKYNALDYLTKPVNRDRLINSVERVAKIVNSKLEIIKYEELIDAFESKKLKTITVNELNARKVIQLDKILCIEASRTYSKFYFTDHTNLLVSKPLSYFEDLLQDDTNFYRCHKSWMVALNKIKSFNTVKFEIELDTNQIIKFSRSKKQELQNIFNSMYFDKD